MTDRREDFLWRPSFPDGDQTMARKHYFVWTSSCLLIGGEAIIDYRDTCRALSATHLITKTLRGLTIGDPIFGVLPNGENICIS